MAAIVAACAGCGGTATHVFHSQGVELLYPAGWAVTGFSTTVSPARLVIASYPVRRADVEGDCGGRRALARLPRDGAAVLLIDYGVEPGAGASFRPRPQHLRLDQFAHATYECFGESFMLRFALGGRRFQAQVALGADATARMRAQALRIIESVAPR